ncbi:MAG: glycosyltransferase family 39 protein [Roseibacillus sp.]
MTSPKATIIRFPRLCLIALAAIMLLPGLDSLPLIDRDEPRFAHATVEMMYRGEWVVPYFNDEYRFDKPPLTYWWMRVHFAVFGVNEFAARLHSALASALCALLIFGFARRLGCDNLRAFFAGAGWLSCLQVLVHSRMAVADMPLILFLILTMRALWELQNRDPERPFAKCFSDPWFYLLGVSLGLGFLAKGPLAQFIPLLAILLWATLNRFQKRPSPNFARLLLYFLVSAPIWLGLMGAWGIPAQIATEGEFYKVGIGRHVVERGTGAFNSRLFIPGVYYLVAMLPFLLPWSSRIPDAFKNARAGEQAQTGSFLLAWFLSPLLIFSFYATQLPHYILPGYPAFFLLLFLNDVRHPVKWFGKTISLIGVVLPFGGALFFLLCSALIPSEGEIAVLKSLLQIASLAILLLGVASWLIWKHKTLLALTLALPAALVLIPASKKARDAHITIRLKEALKDHQFDTRVSWKFNEPSLVWYFDDGEDFKWSKIPENLAHPDSGNVLMVLEHRRWRIDDKTVGAILRREEKIPPTKERRGTPDWEKMVASLPPTLKWKEVKVIGWSPATSSWIEVVAIVSENTASTVE